MGMTGVAPVNLFKKQKYHAEDEIRIEQVEEKEEKEEEDMIQLEELKL